MKVIFWITGVVVVLAALVASQDGMSGDMGPPPPPPPFGMSGDMGPPPQDGGDGGDSGNSGDSGDSGYSGDGGEYYGDSGDYYYGDSGDNGDYGMSGDMYPPLDGMSGDMYPPTDGMSGDMYPPPDGMSGDMYPTDTMPPDTMPPVDGGCMDPSCYGSNGNMDGSTWASLTGYGDYGSDKTSGGSSGSNTPSYLELCSEYQTTVCGLKSTDTIDLSCVEALLASIESEAGIIDSSGWCYYYLTSIPAYNCQDEATSCASSADTDFITCIYSLSDISDSCYTSLSLWVDPNCAMSSWEQQTEDPYMGNSGDMMPPEDGGSGMMGISGNFGGLQDGNMGGSGGDSETTISWTGSSSSGVYDWADQSQGAACDDAYYQFYGFSGADDGMVSNYHSHWGIVIPSVGGACAFGAGAGVFYMKKRKNKNMQIGEVGEGVGTDGVIPAAAGESEMI